MCPLAWAAARTFPFPAAGVLLTCLVGWLQYKKNVASRSNGPLRSLLLLLLTSAGCIGVLRVVRPSEWARCQIHHKKTRWASITNFLLHHQVFELWLIVKDYNYFPPLESVVTHESRELGDALILWRTRNRKNKCDNYLPKDIQNSGRKNGASP